MKLGPVTKLDMRNKTTSKKFDVDVMLGNYDVIVIFRICGQFGAVQRPDSGHRVCKSYVFSNSNLLSYKNWKQNWKTSNTALTLLLWVKVLFLDKNANSLKKKCWHQQNWGGLDTKRYIFWNYIWVCTYVPNLKFLA